MACFAVILIWAVASWIAFPHRPFIRWGLLYPVCWVISVTAFAAVHGYLYGCIIPADSPKTDSEDAGCSVFLWTGFVALPTAVITSFVAALEHSHYARHFLRNTKPTP